MLQNCIVHGPAQQVQTGFIRDASVGGLGLGRVAGLKRGDHVRVDLANGRQLHGNIAWVQGSSVGLRFDVTLEPSDSLIAV
ncbi:MAG: PilZ domain-containing protein [Hyphomicrobium sp.]|nr:PilZ domain-containing protein [Hyphomicrobium sp.]